MSTAKTKISIEFIEKFLKENFSSNISDLEFVSGGEVSQAFSFISEGRELIIRANPTKLGFEKDVYAYERFRSSLIPIPKTIVWGRLNDALYYSITEKTKGKSWDKISKDELQILIPEILKALDAIHAVDISDTIGFGDWGADGKGEDTDWQDYLMKTLEEIKPSHPQFAQKSEILELDFVGKLVERYRGAFKVLSKRKISDAWGLWIF